MLAFVIRLYYAAIRRKGHGDQAENSDNPNAQSEVAKVDKSSAEAGHDVYEAGGTGDGERIERRRAREPGPRPGTIKISCIVCDGEGYIRMTRYGSGFQTCLSCDGKGTVVLNGEREGDSDRRTQPTWGDVLRFSLMVAFFTAFGCYLLYTYAKVH